MKWGVGLAVGNKRSIAAIARPDSELVTLERESVLHHAPDGTVQLGGTAAGSTGLRGFLDRVGTDDTDNFRAHDARGGTGSDSDVLPGQGSPNTHRSEPEHLCGDLAGILTAAVPAQPVVLSHHMPWQAGQLPVQPRDGVGLD